MVTTSRRIDAWPSVTSWNAFWRSIGVPDDELPTSGDAADSIVDPDGTGPRIWFQRVPEVKTVKNRVHLDLQMSGGREFRWPSDEPRSTPRSSG